MALLAASVAATVLTVGAGAGAAATGSAGGSALPDFGSNVLIFDPSMSTSQIQAQVDAIANQQVDNEMGTQRYALLFKPGIYGSAASPLTFQVGYYTEVAGLGASPTDVTINGHVDVYNRCLAPNNCIALNNFWRSLSNLTINVMGLDGCRASGNFWAVSQAAPMRRVKITGGNLTLQDYCTAGPQYASGGFIADSQTGFVVNGSQQQFLVRNSSIGGWSNGVWNQVFSGVTGAPPQSFSTTPYDPQPYTTITASPVTREKPFLYVDGSEKYRVFVPAVQRDSAGTTWAPGPGAGSSIPIDQFFIAKPTDSEKTINKALDKDQNVIFTPGVYHLGKTLKVKKNDTVVLGLGFATLVPPGGDAAMTVADVKGVALAGLMFDAGPKNSPVLLELGTKKAHKSDPANPTSLHDVFFRIGGATAGKATTSLIVNSDNVVMDDIWVWRADHGNANTFGWTINTADTGVIVNGDDVTAYGLFVEHFQKYQLIWNGERGRTIFFQNEMPYDPPNQAAWMHDGVKGYAAYKVADSVKTHEAWGLGSYCFFNVDPSIHATRAFEVPVTPGVRLRDLLTVSLGGVGTIEHVVNDTGAAAQGASTTPVNIVSFPVALETEASANVVVGDAIHDTATLTGVTTSPVAGGSITFKLYGPNDATCTGAAIFTATVPVSGNGSYVSGNFTPTAVGTYRWIANYSGDATNMATGNSCNGTNESVVVSPALTQMDLPVTFDSPTVAYGLAGFGGAEDSTVVVDPTDAANKVAKVVKSATAELWAGTTLTADGTLGFANKVPFTASATTMSVRVWSPDAGIQVRLKVEDHTNPGISVETEATTTVAGGWQTLTFDFANQAAGTAALNLANTYDKASIFFNFGVTGATAGAKTYYFDDVAFGG